MAQKNSVPRQIGKMLAHIQDTVDVAFNWGFHKLKNVKLNEEDELPAKSKAKKVANTLFSFFGTLGESFYEEYEDIKKKRNKK